MEKNDLLYKQYKKWMNDEYMISEHYKEFFSPILTIVKVNLTGVLAGV